MTDKEKASDWTNAVRNVQGRDLAWHLTAVLEFDGEAVCALVLKELGVKSAMDFVRRAA